MQNQRSINTVSNLYIMSDNDLLISYSNAAIAVMVHKLFADRVQEFLSTPRGQIPWVKIRHGLEKNQQQVIIPQKWSSKEEPKKSPENDSYQHNENSGTTNTSENASIHLYPNVELLDSSDYTGHSQDRRGFYLLLVHSCKRPIQDISAMARKNISFAAKITHQIILNNKPEHIDDDTSDKEPKSFPSKDDIQRAATQIWRTIAPSLADLSAAKLRIDVHPKKYTNELCLGLQRECHQETKPNSTTNTKIDPFDGPITMTMSASKCTHRLFVIVSSSDCGKNEGISKQNIYWGLLDRMADEPFMDMKLNQEADKEIVVVSPDLEAGEDSNSTANVAAETPLSRAYYKLDQVWKEILKPNHDLVSALHRLEASAVDFGCAPGGWAQVLVHCIKAFKTVVCVDRGIIAKRITNIPHVHQVHGILEDSQSQVESYGPFAMVVCDASALWDDAMESFAQIVVHNSSDDKNNTADNESMVRINPKFTLPCIFVITLKCPHRRQNSIRGQIQKFKERIPTYLSAMTAAMYPDCLEIIETTSIVTHLMANSDAERTFVVIFEKAQKDN